MKGKRVFITGGAKGIGAAMAGMFSEAGARVAFCDTDRPEGNRLSAALPGENRFYETDVTDAAALTDTIRDVFSRWGDIDILINNVGIGLFSPLTESTVEQFDRVLATNLRPVFILSRLWAIHRNHEDGKKRYGRIVNISSTRYLQSEAGTEGYAASKGGIVSLTHALAVSLSDYNITVNCIAPGWIETGDYTKLKREDHLQHPSGRVGRPDDIARTCLFLCREENDFINGQNITVDGGMTRKMIYVE